MGAGTPLSGSFGVTVEGTSVAATEAAWLLRWLGADVVTSAGTGPGGPAIQAGAMRVPVAADGDPVRVWAESGLSALVGVPGQAPPAVDPAWLQRLRGQLAVLDLLAQRAGAAPLPADHDAAVLLGERAALVGHRGWGDTAPGGSCRMLRAADAWLAVNLARPDDIDMVPAWLELDGVDDGDVWSAAALRLPERPAADWLERAGWLGLPVAPVGPPPADDEQLAERGQGPIPVPFLPGPSGGERPDRRVRTVVDLSALWAGPLAASLLGRTGARVLKVEHRRRPDGARRGSRQFYELLNAGKDEVALDFDTTAGRAELRELCAAADVVIEASRPRALRQLGIDADELVAEHGVVWVSITGYGRTGPWSDRVAFGDDAGAAGGLVVMNDDRAPWFVGDAVADPITGIAAAIAALAGLAQGRGRLFDVAMRETVAHLVAGSPPARLRAPAGPDADATPDVDGGAVGWRLRSADGAWVRCAPASHRSPGSRHRRGTR
ncbi:MAG: CoA transferase [Acidimicrobiales bacterium]|nr:CoA transferase [Acidimicrobiales bacterium]